MAFFIFQLSDVMHNLHIINELMHNSTHSLALTVQIRSKTMKMPLVVKVA